MNVKLNEFIYKLNQPCVFKNILKASDDESETNTAIKWTPDRLETLLKNEKLTFRIGKKQKENLQFENECQYVEATMTEFIEWNESNLDVPTKKRKLNANPFEKFDKLDYWAYADYKYMIELLKSDTNEIEENCINWSKFGFENRNAKDSTLWIGSKEAYTPCHFDTYGYNLVAQIYGSKRWIMFPKNDIELMYSTRIPFEESTVYSQINIKSPDLNRFSKFKNTRPHIVDLKPGEVLYVPNNWWHYVESITNTTISLNSWIELETADNYSRLKEIISKTLLQSIMESNLISFEEWVNSSEDYLEQENNIEILQESLLKIKPGCMIEDGKSEGINYKELIQNHPNFSYFVQEIKFDDYINQFTIKTKIQENELSNDANKNLVFRLAKAVTDPTTISLITENFINLKIQ